MLHLFGLSFLAIFVSLDIVGTLPMFVNMTHTLTAIKRNRIVNTSMCVALGVAILFAFVGEGLFHFLAITLFDFEIAGGLVLLLVSLADLAGGPEAINHSSGSTGIVPLAVPLITGPGVITTLLLQVNSVGYLVSLSALCANYLLAWFILRHSVKITRVLGKDGTVVISKIAALLLATIAVSMIRTGVFGAVAAFNVSK
ncbi:MAG: MarC family protein [Bdellovibrionia bacterium]